MFYALSILLDLSQKASAKSSSHQDDNNEEFEKFLNETRSNLINTSEVDKYCNLFKNLSVKTMVVTGRKFSY